VCHTILVMSRLREEEIGDFVAKLASRYEAYTRNKARNEKTGEEVIIPVSENANAREELQLTIDELCVLYLTVSDEGRDHIRKLVQAHRPLHNGLLVHIVGPRNTSLLIGCGMAWPPLLSQIT
jgi:hypothetical protein